MLSGPLKRLMRGGALDEREAEEAFGAALDRATPATQASAVLVAWRMKGETAEEIAGAVRAARANAEALLFDGPVIDVCGTGGDARNTFNVSTAAAVVAASAGARVLKLVSPMLTSRAGSRELLEAIGFNCDAPMPRVASCLEEHGLAFVSRAVACPGLDALAQTARSLGVRTLVDLVVPLAGPASRRLLGIHDARYLERTAAALTRLGAPHSWVVHGTDGMDELTTSETTRVLEVQTGVEPRAFEVAAGDVGLPSALPESLKGGTAKENAGMFREVLRGERPGPLSDLVALNAGAALVVSGEVDQLSAGVRLAQEVMKSGMPWSLFEKVLERMRG